MRGQNMALRSTQSRNRAAGSTQGGVARMVMDCGTCIIFIRFPQTWDCLSTYLGLSFKCSPFMWMLVFMLEEDRCKCEWKPTTKYATKYIGLVSFLHIHTNYLDLQAWKKLALGGVKAFNDYMCTSVNVKKWISYKVNETNKICYTVQHIKVQDLYIFTMLHVCTFNVFTG